MLESHLPNHPPVTLEFNELNFSVIDSPSKKAVGSFRPYVAKQMKPILKDASGIFKPGELTAIMGPSGAGKSTLMNILAGYKTQNVQGSIIVSGKSRDLAQFRKMSCYIMQDDVLLPHLTVYESMKYAAQLKLPLKTTKSQKELVIKEILDIIGLTKCQNVKASSISGGQRKRLAIALELINNPPIMFFDEPTSGLDSASCYSCVTLLKALAQGGRTIIATIHQPSARIFEQFDSLYLLEDGHCLYRGPTRSVVPFIARQGLQCPPYHNPADFIIEIASGDYGNQWIGILANATALSSDSLISSNSSGLANDCIEDGALEEVQDESITLTSKAKEFQREVGNINHDEEVTVILIESESNPKCITTSVHDESRLAQFANQFFTLLRRSFLCISRDMMLTRLRIATTLIVGLLVGSIYHGAGNDAESVINNLGNLFFGLLFITLSSLMPTLLTFPLERGVLVREHLNCWYSLKSYFIARTCADLPFQVLFPFLYVVIMYYMSDQPQEAFRFWIVAGMHICISLVAQSLGLLIGAACHVQNAVFIGPVTAIPMFLFAGFIVSIESVPIYLRWISWFAYPKYSFQSILTAVYGLERENLKCYQAYCHFKNPKKILDQLDAVDIDVANQFYCIIAYLLVVRVLAYYALRYKIRVEK
ncbi:ATP-binding cassette sub-family G member 1 [Orchesella cincta]|uniref:ATP-binding cassette sub-family G member 1 n=1 Tax=Orchesella cincta TaxID=48709 RepID=A0A1D2MNJ6_ORCCI|nr:ATP-binding cassette sub-family G member 1 [Orchesella cincta]